MNEPYITYAMLSVLIIGLIMTAAGVALIEEVWTSGIGIYLILGVLFLVCSFGMRYSLTKDIQTKASTALAQYIFIEFMAGAGFAIVAAMQILDKTDNRWGVYGLIVFGIALILDSFVFYRRRFLKVSL